MKLFLLQFMNQTRGYPRDPLGRFLWLGVFAAWPHARRVLAGSLLVKVLFKKNSPRQLHIMLRCVGGRDGTNWSDSEAFSGCWGTSWYLTAFCGPVYRGTIFNVQAVLKKTRYVFLYLMTYVINKSTCANGPDCLLVIRNRPINPVHYQHPSPVVLL